MLPPLSNSLLKHMYYFFRLFISSIIAMTLFGGCGLFVRKPVHEQMSLIQETQQDLMMRQIWSIPIAKAGHYDFAPVVVGHSILTLDGKDSVICIDADTGVKTWSAKIGSDITANPGSDGDTTVVATADGNVIALDSSGKQIWTAPAGGEVLAPPLVGRGLVVVRAINGRVLAFDSVSGAVKWIYTQPSLPLMLRTYSGMIFLGDSAVVASFPGGKLAALDLQTGHPLWIKSLSHIKSITEIELMNDVSGTPVPFGQQICASTFQGRLVCVDAMNGGGIWEREFLSLKQMTQDDQMVVAVNPDSSIFSFSASDGKIYWKNDLLKCRGLSAPLAFGHLFVVGDLQGYVHFLSRDTGELVFRMKTSSAVSTQPVLAGQTLVIKTCDGNLIGYYPK
ncbi:outer membrane protein assembly factor BamB [Candidatus Pandoraea novymonadis]|nr:outer membrane protein assembly factor BamB [Candidatus Pandoraea novymonadis]